jgi:hypothetical protein
VQGNSAAQPITLSGWIKGVGSFNNVVFSGTYDPGFSPTVATVGNIGFAATNVLNVELGGIARGRQYDAVVASGALSLGGSLQVSLINGFTPAAGNSFDIFDWDNLSGTFSTLLLPALSSSLSWDTSQLHTTGFLTVVSRSLPGDYNQNGSVDAADYVVWRNGLGTIYSQADYDVWRTHFGQTAGSGAGTESASLNATVPESSTLLLLLAATILGLTFRVRFL